jgi:molybdate transport system ATP-binding protein
LSGPPADLVLPSSGTGHGHAKGCTPLVEMIDVHVQYEDNVVLKNIDWTIREGENWMVQGPDGAGKTTLLKLISGDNLQAYANDIFLFGQKKGSGESVWEIKQKIGWISADLRSKYPTHIKAAEVVYSGFFDSVGLFRKATAAQRERAEGWLSALNLDHLAQELYGELSHGQKQMLLIARAIVKSPALLLLDEPWEGLDFANCRKISEIIEYIGHHRLSTVVCTTSDQDVILPCITHQLKLDGGVATISDSGSTQI